MSSSVTFADPRLKTLDGFRVEIDLEHERADVILDRPPFNIVSMPQRDQLRLVFEALDEDARVRVIVLRAVGEHFSSGGNIKGFMEASPEHVSNLAWNIAAPSRCSKPVIAANRGYWRWLRTFARLRLPHRLGNRSIRITRAEARTNTRFRRLRAATKDRRHYAYQGYRDAFTPNSCKAGL